MNFIKSDRIAKNSLKLFVAFALCFCVNLLLNLTGLTQIFIIRQIVEYIPYCFMAGAFAFFAMTAARFFIHVKPTRIFYLILFALFAVLIFDKIVFLDASHQYDVFRVIAETSGLFCAMVLFDKYCDADLNNTVLEYKKYGIKITEKS
jgi:hypothetical protein